MVGKWAGLSLGALLYALSVQAQETTEGIIYVYDLAAENDPAILAARAARDAAIEARPQGLARLLPEIGFDANTIGNRENVSTDGVGEDGVTRFNSNAFSFALTQPLIDYDAFMQWRQADSQVAEAEATYQAAWQALIVRVSERYIGVLGAIDNLGLARAEKKAISRQLEQATERFDVGLSAITDVYEAQAGYDLAVAGVLEADNGVANAREQLREITGQLHYSLVPFSDSYELVSPVPSILDTWVEVGVKQNLEVLAAASRSEAARQNIERQRSGHFPTLDLTMGYTDLETGGRFGSSETKRSRIGLELNLPLFSGGAVNSRLRQSHAQFDEARQLFEGQRRAVVRDVSDAYRGVMTNIGRVHALKQALRSTEVALEAIEVGFEVGTRTIVDVLDAQRTLYRARRDYLAERYKYVLNTLRLKQFAGTLKADDLQLVDSWLAAGGGAQGLPTVPAVQ